MPVTQIKNNVIANGTIAPAKLNVTSAVQTFLENATSFNLAAAISDETGSGSLVFATNPTLTTPTIGTINGSVFANGSITVQGTSSTTRTTSNVNLQPSGGGVTIGGTTRNASAILQVNSTTLGILPPVMTIAQRNAIASPAEGLVVYVNDAGGKGISLHNGTAWGNVLTTHAASFTSDTLAAALSDENGTGGGFVRAEGATLTSPSLVGPVNLTSQDASTGARVMNRDLADARYARSVIAIATTNQDATNTSTLVASTQCVINITEPGVYFIETSEQVVSSAWATAGARSSVVATGSFVDGPAYGCTSTRTSDTFLNQQFFFNNNWTTLQSISNPTQSQWVMRTGLITFSTTGTIALGFSQFAAVSGQFARLQARSFIRATRIA
jgi:hypothetical protein